MPARRGFAPRPANRKGPPTLGTSAPALASGQILIFLDADTHLPPEAIRRIATLCWENRYEAGMTKLGALDGGRSARYWWAFWNAVCMLPLARAKSMPACMFCTRVAFAEFGPFDERVAIGEEWPILGGLYRSRRDRLIYDRATVALTPAVAWSSSDAVT